MKLHTILLSIFFFLSLQSITLAQTTANLFSEKGLTVNGFVKNIFDGLTANLLQNTSNIL